jgi:hypothetical protein
MYTVVYDRLRPYTEFVTVDLGTRVLCPNINVKIVFGILYDSGNIVNGFLIYVLISVMVMVSFMMKAYYTQRYE